MHNRDERSCSECRALTCRKCVGAVAGFCSRSTIGTGGLVLAPDRLAALPPCHTAGFLYPGNRYMLFFE
jgi:hypothetical protein